jgi:hypothetical protein
MSAAARSNPTDTIERLFYDSGRCRQCPGGRGSRALALQDAGLLIEAIPGGPSQMSGLSQVTRRSDGDSRAL